MKEFRNGERARRRVAYLAFAGAAMDALFWSLYLAGIITVADAGNEIATDFESAFLLADCALGAFLFAAGIGLLKNRTFGGFCLIAASAMAIYLGILDITFYAGKGLYLPLTFSSIFEIFINAACIFGGATGLLLGNFFWRNGRETAPAHVG